MLRALGVLAPIAVVGCGDLFHSTDWTPACGDAACAQSGGAAAAGGAGAGAAGAEGGSGAGEAGGAADGCALRVGGADAEQLTRMAVHTSGGVVIAGGFTGEVTSGSTMVASHGGVDALVARIDAACQVVWMRALGGAGDDVALGLAVESNGDVYVSGEFSLSADFGDQDQVSAGATDAFVVRLDGASGDTVWSRAYGGSATDAARGVTVLITGNLMITGEFDNTIDFGGGTLFAAGADDLFLARLSAAGDHVWSRRIGGGGNEIGRAIAATADDGAIVVGEFEGIVGFDGLALASKGGFDAFAAGFDPQGQSTWARSFGDASVQHATDVAVDPVGNAFVVGAFQGIVDFGNGAITAPPSAEAGFVSKLLGATGTPQWGRGLEQADGSLIHAVVADADEVLIGATFAGTIELGGQAYTGAGDEDGLMVRLQTTDGEHLQSAAFIGEGAQRVMGVGDSTQGSFVAGVFEADLDVGVAALHSAGGTDLFVVRRP